MTNLLPPPVKKQIVLQYWVRVFSVWVILWSACLLVSAIILWPTYVLIVGSSEAYSESLASAVERTSEFESISSDLEQATKQAQTIIVGSRQPLFSEKLTDIWSEAGQGIVLDSVDMARTEGFVKTISLGGEAVDRQSLAMFRDRLELLPYVQSVDLPIGNLAQNQDIEFSLVIMLNQTNS